MLNPKANRYVSGIPADKFKKISFEKLYRLNWVASREVTRPRRNFWMFPCSDCKRFVTRNEALRGNVRYAMGELYHDEHIKCGECNIKLVVPAPIDCMERRGRLSCIDCVENEMAPKCDGCSKTLRERAVVAFDKKYHRECFTCAHCRETIGEDGYIEENGKAYDEDCYFQKTISGLGEPLKRKTAEQDLFGNAPKV